MGLALLITAALGLSGKLMAGTQTSQKTSKSSTTGKSSTSSKSHASTKKARAKRGRKEKGQTAPTADRISAIQAALAKGGSFSGSPNGKWDDATVEAMKKFQTAHGLNPSGKIDALTLQKLGLGSQTAGVAAPMPPMGSSSKLRPSS
jgi:peptidoglycan hydrolase-like protein with peptidoglycan-binding domain